MSKDNGSNGIHEITLRSDGAVDHKHSDKLQDERKPYRPMRVALDDLPKPPFTRGRVGWVASWSRFIIVLYAEDGFLMAYPCKEDGSTDGLAPPVLVQELRVKPTGVHREI